MDGNRQTVTDGNRRDGTGGGGGRRVDRREANLSRTGPGEETDAEEDGNRRRMSRGEQTASQQSRKVLYEKAVYRRKRMKA